MKNKLYDYIFKTCKYICHQKPERSFFIKTYQFPVCSRCLGIIISFLISLLLINLNYIPNYIISFTLIIPMFLDWLIQFLKIKESNNVRRLITGFIGGFGLSFTYYKIILFFIK